MMDNTYKTNKCDSFAWNSGYA